LSFEASQSSGANLPEWLSFDSDTRTFSGTPLDADAGTLSIRITATDGSAASITDEFNLVVSAVNDAPVFVSNDITLHAGDTITLTASMLSAIDVDNADTSLIFTVSGISGGQFELNGARGTSISSFTQAQVAAGDVVFVDDGDNTAPAYNVAVTDGMASQSPVAASVTFTPAPDPVVEALPTATPTAISTISLDHDVPVAELTADVAADEFARIPAAAAEPEVAPEEISDSDIPVESTHSNSGDVSSFTRPVTDVGDIRLNNTAQSVPNTQAIRPVAMLAAALPQVNTAPFQFDPLGAEIRSVLVSDNFIDSLDRMGGGINKATLAHQIAVGSGITVTTGLSVGYVAWLLRGGILLSTALSSLPAWQFIDPLPVLAHGSSTDDDEDGNDSLEDIINDHPEQADASEAALADNNMTSPTALQPDESPRCE
jgi:hypothetical protein